VPETANLAVVLSLGLQLSRFLEKIAGWSVAIALGTVSAEGVAFQFTCGELIGDCIVRFCEVSRAGWVKATQAKWPTLQRQ
jgi:hypothetical protein